MTYLEKLKELRAVPDFPDVLIDTLEEFFQSYEKAVDQNGNKNADCQKLLITYLDLIIHQLQSPFAFDLYHEKIREPNDLYGFGIDFTRLIVQLDQSTVEGLNVVDEIAASIDRNENVILFANHQIEPDPQAISLMLESTHPHLVEKMIFVAGHRVTTDPIAVPFSMGCNLLCIYSKNYIDHPPEEKPKKIAHNQRTMKKMRELLAEGGKCIYVAPSGGRDRPNEEGVVEVAPFDYQSIEMFHFIASHSKTPTHFYPLALNTYPLLPPPQQVVKSLGEARVPQCTPIHLAFGEEIAMDQIPISLNQDKKTQRIEKASFIHSLVCQLYKTIS